jgi:hypothetical protein
LYADDFWDGGTGLDVDLREGEGEDDVHCCEWCQDVSCVMYRHHHGGTPVMDLCSRCQVDWQEQVSREGWCPECGQSLQVGSVVDVEGRAYMTQDCSCGWKLVYSK